MVRGAKTKVSSSATVVEDATSSGHQEQAYILPVCQLPLPEYGRPQAIHWNDHGQACLVTETVLYILTPSIGYHPLLKPNQTSQVDQDALLDLPATPGDKAKPSQSQAAVHDFSGKAKPLDFFSSAIDMPTFQAVTSNSAQQKNLDSQDYDAINPGILGNVFRHAAWSPAGLGQFGSCLLAAIDTNCNAKIIAASNNPVVGPWATQQALKCSQGLITKDDRFKVLADQAVSLAWSPALQSVDVASTAALLAVGMRSGEVVIWHRSSADTAFSSPTRIQIGHSAVTSVAWSTQINRSGDSKHHFSIILTAALVQGPRLLDVTVQGELKGGRPLVSAQALPVQPPLFADHPQISALRVIRRDELLVCTPGQVRTWTFPNQHHQGASPSTLPVNIQGQGQWATCLLTVSEHDEDTKDPCAYAIACTLDQDHQRLRLFLTSRLEYSIPLSALPASISPLGSVSTQRSLALYSAYKEADYLLTDLSRQVESHQVLLGVGLASESRSDGTGAADVVSIVQSDGDTSAFRVRLDRSCKLSLLLSIKGGSEGAAAPSPTNILRRLLDDIQDSIKLDESNQVTPIQRHRALLALYYSSTLPLQKAFLVVMAESLAASVDQGAEASATVSQQNTLWLSKWLQRQLDSLKPLPDSLRAAAQSVTVVLAKVYSELMTRWLTGQLQWLKDTANINDAEMDASKTYIQRLTAVSCWLQYSLKSQGNGQNDELVHLIHAVVNKFNVDAAEVVSWRKGADANLDEHCPACNASVAFSPAVSGETETFKLPEWLQCPSGHVFKRCSLTFDILASSQVRTCEGCWNKTKHYDQVGDYSNGGIVDEALRRTQDKCVFCGCRWLSLV